VRRREIILTVLVLLCAMLVIAIAIGIYFPGPEKTDGIGPISFTPSSDNPDPATMSPGHEPAFGAESNPTGSPIGGGDGYRKILTPIDPGVGSIVTTTDELLAALRDAGSGDVVYIDETARIDLTDAPGGVIIPGGVTLASNRGERSTPGTATYQFEIEEPGDYVLWARALVSGEEGGSFWVSVDGGELQRWDLEADPDWHWNRGGAHYLPGGQHSLNIHWRGGDLNLDKLIITYDTNYLPGVAVEEREGETHLEAESGVLSPELERTEDPATSGGAYVSAVDESTGSEGPVSSGGRIYFGPTGPDRRVGFIAGGEHVRVTGLCLEGPHTGIDQVDHSVIGIYSAYRNMEVDNCEIFGWSGAAIGIAGTGGADMQTGGYIHHNYIHHCQMDGFGYGVVVSGGAVSLIEANYFDYCRHAIAGSGVAGDGYEARYNICGQNFIAGSSHNFDMHGVVSGTGTIAGDTIRIHHNTFTATGPLNAFPIAIRGIPRDGAYIHHNWFHYTQAPPVWQTGGQGNVHVTENLIGLNRTLSPSGPIEYY